MITLLYIYLFSTVAMFVLSVYEWKTEEDHKGWKKPRFFMACFAPVANTAYCISAVMAFFRWVNK